MVITLKEALQIINTSERFNLKVVTADKVRNKGGEILEIDNGYLQKYKGKADRSQASEGSKAQNHYANLTRNIYRDNGHPVKIHIFLITEVNGKEVTLY